MKGSSCNLLHVETVDDLQDREGIVKSVFCHDYQNKLCPRPYCKYIHATREEEIFFQENGFFSPTLNKKNQDKMFFSNICIDHLRSQCIRGQSCHFRHVNYVESHQERVTLSRSIFCHDFQETRCDRTNCKLIHTKKSDEQYFLRTGMLPDTLKLTSSSKATNLDISHLSGNVCREFVKNQCTRGQMCRFYHPTPAELQALLAQQQSFTEPGMSSMEVAKEAITGGGGGGGGEGEGEGEGGGGGGGGGGEDENGENSKEELAQENSNLKTRVEQLERLLADACHCITLAVGDQNPAVATLMKTIAEMAPTSSLANQSEVKQEQEEEATT